MATSDTTSVSATDESEAILKRAMVGFVLPNLQLLIVSGEILDIGGPGLGQSEQFTSPEASDSESMASFCQTRNH